MKVSDKGLALIKEFDPVFLVEPKNPTHEFQD